MKNAVLTLTALLMGPLAVNGYAESNTGLTSQLSEGWEGRFHSTPMFRRTFDSRSAPPTSSNPRSAFPYIVIKCMGTWGTIPGVIKGWFLDKYRNRDG
jgi:hypothetical protein